MRLNYFGGNVHVRAHPTLGPVGRIYRVAQSTPEAVQYECASLSGYPLIQPNARIVWWGKKCKFEQKTVILIL